MLILILESIVGPVEIFVNVLDCDLLSLHFVSILRLQLIRGLKVFSSATPFSSQCSFLFVHVGSEMNLLEKLLDD